MMVIQCNKFLLVKQIILFYNILECFSFRLCYHQAFWWLKVNTKCFYTMWNKVISFTLLLLLNRHCFDFLLRYITDVLISCTLFSLCCIQPPNTSDKRKRPVSQPIRFGPCDLTMNAEGRQQNHLPEISEFTAQSTQYASSSSEYACTAGLQFHAAVANIQNLLAWIW